MTHPTTIPPTTIPLLLTALMLVPACTDDDASADSAAASSTTAADEMSTDAAPSTGAAPESTGNADSTGDGIDLDALYDCEDPALFVAQPLSGPGIDAKTGALLEPLQDTYYVHTTQILARPEAMGDFFAMNEMVVEQLVGTEGLIGFSLALEPTCGFARTMGIWADQRSMLLFVGTGVHLDAMTEVADLASTARSTSWAVDGDQMPLTWDMALEAIADIPPVAL